MPDRAIDVFQEAVRGCPTRCPQALDKLFGAYLKTGRLADGEAYFRAFTRAHPGIPTLSATSPASSRSKQPAGPGSEPARRRPRVRLPRDEDGVTGRQAEIAVAARDPDPEPRGAKAARELRRRQQGQPVGLVGATIEGAAHAEESASKAAARFM